MKFKKKKFNFSAPEKYKTGEALHGELPHADMPSDVADTPVPTQPDAAAEAPVLLSAARAERLLRTVELTRAEIDRALAAHADLPAGEPQQSDVPAAATDPADEPAADAAEQTPQADTPFAKDASTEALSTDTATAQRPLIMVATEADPDSSALPDAQPEPQIALAEKEAPPAKPDTFLRRLFAPAHLAFLLLAALLLGPLCLVHYGLGDLYYLQEDGETAAILFSDADVYADVFTQAGIELHAADIVEETALGGSVWLTVTRAYDVTVIADGATIEHKVLGHTTAEALAQLDIAVGPDDIVQPAADKVLVEGETIRVQRVVYETRDVIETVAWQEITKPSPLIREGKTQVMNSGGGRDGLAERTYRDTYIDGVLTDSEIIAEKYEDLPWNVVTLAGKDDAIMSPINGADFTDVTIVDNAPTSYERVLESAVCTAYSFKPGTYGASGMYMFQGFVAVNTNVIPYGSLLYITSPTGNFTYGWAIAADVGEAMMDGYVDIDLFFETYTESALFGKHRLNVYVVDQLTQAELAQFMAQPGMFRTRIPAG